LKFHESGWRDEAILRRRRPNRFSPGYRSFLDAWNPIKRYAGIEVIPESKPYERTPFRKKMFCRMMKRQTA
jgi:hypothetical protein